MFFAPFPSALRSRFVPAPSLRTLDQNVERFLQQTFAGPARPADEPGRSLTQDEKSYQLVLDLPGISREQLTIEIEGNQLRIATKPDAPRAHQAGYEFPLDIDAAASEAKLENGVLTLKLVKQVPQSNAVTLAIS